MIELVMLEKRWRCVAAGLILFGISFGYVEAAVVIYAPCTNPSDTRFVPINLPANSFR
jgi:hypothetical protein